MSSVSQIILFLFSILTALPGLAQNTNSGGANQLEVELYGKEDFRATRTREFDLLHTKLELSFDWERQWVNGTATLDLTPVFYPQEVLMLDAKGMQINEVHLPGGTDTVEKSVNYEYDGRQLLIELGQTAERGDTLSVVINYTAKPEEYASEGSEAITDDQGLYLINPLGKEEGKPRQIWTQGETDGNSVWFPTIDSPNERCTQEMLITVDDAFKTLSNGLLISSEPSSDGQRTDHWIMDKPHAPYLFMLAIGDFTVVEDAYGSIPLEYWVEDEYKESAKDIFENTPEMLAYFSELFGYPYPWDKYAQVVVRDFVSGAMENTTASVFMEEVQIDQRTLLDYNWDYIIAHELVHQWFGDLVTCESWSYLPLNEAFANYGEYLWNEYKYGQDEADYSLQEELYTYLAEAEEQKVELIRYYYEDQEDMFDAHSYSKGGRVLHMLRSYIGDEAFFESLSVYLSENEFSATEVDHLRLAFEEVTGEDLNWFFDQWFFNPGHPQVEVEHFYKKDTLHLKLMQLQDLTISPIYRLPFYIDIHLAEEIVRYPIVMENLIEEYALPIDEKPELVVVDPENQMLWELYHPKSLEELYSQYFNGGRYLLRKEAIDSIASSDSDDLKASLLETALSDPYIRLQVDAIDYYLEYPELLTPSGRQTIIEMLNDSTSAVRSSALRLLTILDFPSMRTQTLAALGDSSYNVVGTALAALYEYDLQAFESTLDKFSDYTNINVVIPIASYHSERASAEAFDYFRTKIYQVGRNDLYYLLQYINTYLLIAPSDQQQAMAPLLVSLAQSHKNYTVRFAALQGLFLLIDLPEMEDQIKQVMEAETDPQLQEIYLLFEGDLN
ncbi:MAG: M1 family metallopeptidase [Cyclobacteriaceae bacterium]